MILYQYSAGVERDFLSGGPSTRWELAKEPLETLSLRMGSLLYLRGDVEASSLKIPVAVDDSCLGAQANWRYPKLLRNLGLVGAVGSVAPENGKLALPAGAKALVSLNASQRYSFPDVKNVSMVKGDEASRLAELEKTCGFGKGFLDLARQRARSSTGELEIDALAKTFSVATPRSEALVVPGEGAFGTSVMKVENKGGFAVFFVAALDGKELRNSSRMLLLHLTDVVNSGLKFRSKEMKVVEDMGKLPFLARRGSALVALSLGKGAARGAWTLYGLDFSGKRFESRAASPSAEGDFKLQLDGYATKEPRMAYELVREPAASPGR
jgi:hypothetical protein